MRRGVLVVGLLALTAAGCGGTSAAARSSTSSSSSPPPIVVTSRPFVPSPSPSPTTLDERCIALSTDVGVIDNLTASLSTDEVERDLDAVLAALARDAAGTPTSVRTRVATIVDDVEQIQRSIKSRDNGGLEAAFQKLTTDSNALDNSCTSAS